jgi:hypothetical protein
MGLKNSKTTLLKELNTIFTEWCTNSTAHAIPNIFRTDSKQLKFIWTISLLISASYCFYSVFLSIINYYSYPIYTNTQIINEIPTKFPAVSICNLKLTNKTSSKSYLDNLLYVNGVQKFPRSFFGSSIFMYIMANLYSIQATISSDSNLTSSSRRALGFEMSDMLLTCSYAQKACTENDFTHFFHPTFGNCFTFNKGFRDNGSTMDIVESYVSGPDFGLSIELFLGDPNVQTQYQFNDGIIVVIHNQTSMPLLNGDRVLVSTGHETDVKVNRKFTSKLSYPHGDCLKDATKDIRSDYIDYIVNRLGLSYNQQYCYLVCLQTQIINFCNCSCAILPSNNTSNLCYTLPQLNCMMKYISSFENKGNLCSENCPAECDSVKYIVSTSRATYPSVYYQDLLQSHPKIKQSGIAKDNINKAMIRLNVFYESLEFYAVVEEPALSSETFYSYIGGTLGLYLGISILSMIEILELLILCLQFCCQKKKVAETKVEIFK